MSEGLLPSTATALADGPGEGQGFDGEVPDEENLETGITDETETNPPA
jgi:hypothetical protein